MAASCPWFVAESTRPRVLWRLVAAWASTSEPVRRLVPTRLITPACSLVTCTRRSATWPKSRIERRSSLTAVESNAVCTRFATVAMSVAMRLACAVSWPMSGSVAPGQRVPPAARASARSRRTLGSSGSSSSEYSDAAHSPNSEADAAITAGRGGIDTPE